MKITHASTPNGGFNPLVLVLVLIVSALLVGCASSKIETKYLTQVTMLKIPDEFKVVKEIPQPLFSPTQAGGLKCERQLELMYEYSDTLLMELGNNKKRVVKLIDWESQQLEVYGPKTK